MATIRDVAKAAGVSIAAVSACINASAPVSPALKRRVEAAVAGAGYRPDALARGLKTGATGMLGLAVDGLADPFTAAVAEAAVQAAAERGYAVLLAGGGDIAGLEARRVEGILAMPGPAEGNGRKFRCPLATVRGASEGFDGVDADFAQMAEAAVEHLAGLGHRRVALVIGPAHVARGERILAGYRRALARHGLSFAPRLVRVAAPGKAKPGLVQQAQDTARALLASQDWPSALIVCGGALARFMAQAMAQAGLACPAGVSIAALGDDGWTRHGAPALTAVAEPARDIGAEAVRLLLGRIRGKEPMPARDVLLPGALTVRESTAPPAS